MRSTPVLALLLLLLLGAGAGAVLFLSGRRTSPPAAPGPAPEAPPRREGAALEGGVAPAEPAQRERLEHLDPAAPSLADAARDDGPLRVRCVDADGHGLAGVKLSGQRRGSNAFHTADLGQGSTDDQGRILFPAVVQPLGWTVVEISLLVLPPEGWTQATWRGPVPAGELVLVLERGAVLFGRVLRGDGSPIPRHAQLQLEWSLGAGLSGSRQFPIEEGRYETSAVLGGEIRRVILVRQEERQVSQPVQGFVVAPGERRELDFVFDVGCDCRATFVDEESGAPIAQAQVRSASFHRVALTDAAGSARLRDVLSAGEAGELRFVHDDYPPLRTPLACPDPPYELELRVPVPRGFELGGVVQDGAGLPLPGLEVRCDRALASETGFGSLLGGDVDKRALTDAEGRFRLRGFAAGEGYRLSFQRDERVLAGEFVAFPGAEQRDVWTIPEPSTVLGRVLGHGGQPVAGVEVAASAQWGLAHARATTEADGSFRLEGLFPGRWLARVPYGTPLAPVGRGRGDQKLATSWFEVAPEGAPFLELRLPARQAGWQLVPFRVRAYDADSGEPIEQASLLLFNGTDSTLSQGLGGATLGAEGFLHSLPEGGYDLFLSVEGYRRASQTLTLEPRNAPLEVEFRLERDE